MKKKVFTGALLCIIAAGGILLAAARRFFNAATTEYNNSVESFPSNLVAKNFGFNREIMFDLGTDTRKQMEEPPKIQF